jgi:hypothetical protein
VAIVEPSRAGAVEGDGADQRMLIEQPVDRVRLFAAYRRVSARLALAHLAHVPQTYPSGRGKGEPLRVILHWSGAE